MTIVKDIYVPSHSFSDVIEMHTYLADPLKTDGGKYVRGLGFITDNYLDELYAVKVANQQTHTTQFRQITVSISSANNAAYSDEELMEIGVDMAKHIHKDTQNPHLHFLANAVNFRTGNIFRQTKKELNRLKVHCNHILNDHCLDQIQMSPEDMLDTAPHDLSDGFEAFEIFDETMMDKAVFFEDLYVRHFSRNMIVLLHLITIITSRFHYLIYQVMTQIIHSNIRQCKILKQLIRR